MVRLRVGLVTSGHFPAEAVTPASRRSLCRSAGELRVPIRASEGEVQR